MVPTDMVTLPSEGKLYPKGHPLHGTAEIELREMTAKEEDILTTEAYARNGTLFDRLLKSLMVDKNTRPEDLLIGDKNALLIAARISAYGHIYEASVDCPVCGEESDEGFDLTTCPIQGPVDLENTEDKELRTAVTLGEDCTYFITLPKCEATVEVRLVTGKDESSLSNLKAMKKKKKLASHPLTDHLKKIIVSVDGITDGLKTSEFVNVLPASDSRFLRRVFGKLTPNVEMTQEFVCESCEYERVLEVPFTSRFFWPDS